MKENLLLLKNLLELQRVSDFNIKKCVFDKLDDIVNEYNNAYHRTIKMKPIDVKAGNYVEYIVF